MNSVFDELFAGFTRVHSCSHSYTWSHKHPQGYKPRALSKQRSWSRACSRSAGHTVRLSARGQTDLSVMALTLPASHGVKKPKKHRDSVATSVATSLLKEALAEESMPSMRDKVSAAVRELGVGTIKQISTLILNRPDKSVSAHRRQRPSQGSAKRRFG